MRNISAIARAAVSIGHTLRAAGYARARAHPAMDVASIIAILGNKINGWIPMSRILAHELENGHFQFILNYQMITQKLLSEFISISNIRNIFSI